MTDHIPSKDGVLPLYAEASAAEIQDAVQRLASVPMNISMEGWQDISSILLGGAARLARLERERPAPETGAVYRKWPGEPPHCMSCDCGMTDEQKRTVPFEDYQTFHTALMAIVYESKSFTEAVKLASDALSHKPPAQKANVRAPEVCGCPYGQCNCNDGSENGGASHD